MRRLRMSAEEFVSAEMDPILEKISREGIGSLTREERRILERRSMRNPRLFGSAARDEDSERSDVDILVEAPSGTSLFDLADVEMELERLLGCKVEVMTRGFLAPDVVERIESDIIPLL